MYYFLFENTLLLLLSLLLLLNFTFILTFKLVFHPICRKHSKALLLAYVEYLLLNKRFNKKLSKFKYLNIFMS